MLARSANGQPQSDAKNMIAFINIGVARGLRRWNVRAAVFAVLISVQMSPVTPGAAHSPSEWSAVATHPGGEAQAGNLAGGREGASGRASDPARNRTPSFEPVGAKRGDADTESAIDIVVTAKKEGPALWRVRKGGATLIILGTVSPLPAGFVWHDWRVKAAIRRSRLMLVSSEPEANFIWMRRWSPYRAKALYQPKDRHLADDLDGEEQRRLRAAIRHAGRDEARYTVLRPAIASMLLYADWRERSGLSNTSLTRELVAFGRKAHVRSQFIRQTFLLPTIDELPHLEAPLQRRCFDNLLANMENERDYAQARAEAWAKGDLAALRGHYAPSATCADAIAVDRQQRALAVQSWTALLLRRLQVAQQTFVMIDVANLLKADGVLAQLSAAGGIIDEPSDNGS
jgi:uncharacterized protein YbaP (TraB family)